MLVFLCWCCVFVVVCSCFVCGGVVVVVLVVWLFFCGGVFVFVVCAAVVFLWRCGVWWCFCGGVVVFLWWCGGVFCGGVVVFSLWCFCGFFCGGVFVFLWWCSCVFVVVSSKIVIKDCPKFCCIDVRLSKIVIKDCPKFRRSDGCAERLSSKTALFKTVINTAEVVYVFVCVSLCVCGNALWNCG